MNSPRSVLIAFMKEMREWELRCAKRERKCDEGGMEYEDAAALGTSDYLAVFNRFCSRDAVPREYFFTEPPDYDPEGEEILEEKEVLPGRIEIRTRQSYSHKKSHIFSIVSEDGEWRIFEKRIALDNGENLVSSL